MKKHTAVLKIIAVIIMAALVLSACEKKPDNGGDDGGNVAAVPQKTISLPFDGGDSMNPFRCESRLNYDIIPLCYDSLYKTDAALAPVNCLAGAGVVDGATVTVTVNAAKFSDGSPVTPADVEYSFGLAKKSRVYSAGLGCFDTCEAAGLSVSFGMNSANRYALSLLTFPIVKTDTAERASDVPVGSGKYRYDKENAELVRNSFNTEPVRDVAVIRLFNIQDTSKLKYNTDMGNISAFTYNFSSFRMSGLLTDVRRQPSNSLVYIGFNSLSAFASDSRIRRAVSKSINRSQTASSVYGQNAVPSYTPFNPEWSEMRGVSLPVADTSVDYSAAAALLNDAGYGEILASGLRTGDSGVLSLTLLVCKDSEYKTGIAETVQTALKKSGINVGILKYSETEYFEALRTGSYDMYIGEVRLPGDCSLSSFYSKNGGTSYGIDRSSASAEKYEEYVSGEADIGEFLTEFFADCPFAPLCFRYDIIAYGTDIEDYGDFAVSGDLYYNIGSWKVSEPAVDRG